MSSVLTDSCAGVDLATALPGDCASAPDKGTCLEGRMLCHTCHLLVIGDNLDEDCDLIDDLTDNGSCD